MTHIKDIIDKIMEELMEHEELEPCPDCGQTIDKGACFYCKMD